MKKTELIREIIRNIDWLDEQEALLFKLGLDRKYLNAIYISGLEILSELNNGRLTILKEFKGQQWLLRFRTFVECITTDLKLYEIESGIKNLLNKL